MEVWKRIHQAKKKSIDWKRKVWGRNPVPFARKSTQATPQATPHTTVKVENSQSKRLLAEAVCQSSQHILRLIALRVAR